MNFLTEDEEQEVERLRNRTHHKYRIGAQLVGIRYKNKRPKYILLEELDLLELEKEIKTDPDRLCTWIRRNLIYTVHHAKTNT